VLSGARDVPKSAVRARRSVRCGRIPSTPGAPGGHQGMRWVPLEEDIARTGRAKQVLCLAYCRKRTVLTTSSTIFFLSWYSEVEVPGNQAVRTSKARPPLSMTTL